MVNVSARDVRFKRISDSLYSVHLARFSRLLLFYSRLRILTYEVRIRNGSVDNESETHIFKEFEEEKN